MTDEVRALVASIEEARAGLLGRVSPLTDAQGAFRPGEGWSISDILEHLYLAEFFGVGKIWSASSDLRAGRRWTHDHPNRGKPIEQVIADTWKPRETAPPVATPHLGAPLQFSRSAFRSLGAVLADLGDRLEGQRLEDIVFPHFLSGPLDARQRLEFLRFHIERHTAQVFRVQQHPEFPLGERSR
jgi:hypothetical protein